MATKTNLLCPPRFYSYETARAIAEDAQANRITSVSPAWNYFPVDGLESGHCTPADGDMTWFVAVLDDNFSQIGTL